jgi:hypothetical protein
MASLWWETQRIHVGTTGDATIAGWLGAIQAGLTGKGYEIITVDDTTIDARRDTVEIAVIYAPGGLTGAFGDGKPWVEVFKSVHAAADDDAAAQAAVDEVWTMIDGIGFL